jgi:hypothetical protein
LINEDLCELFIDELDGEALLLRREFLLESSLMASDNTDVVAFATVVDPSSKIWVYMAH